MRIVVFGSKFGDGLFDGREVEQKPKSSLRRRVSAYIVGILVVNIVALILIQTALLQPSVERLENRLIADDLARIENAIAQEAKALGLKCREWSAWDDPYEVILKPGSEELARFVSDNLVDEYFAAGQISLMAMVDVNGGVVWGELHGADGKLVESISDLGSLFERDVSPFFRFSQTTDLYEGVVASRRGPMILSARPQLNGKFEGPIRGAFLMGKFLDDRLAARLSGQTLVTFTGHDSTRDAEIPRRIGSIRAGEHAVALRDDQFVDAYTAVGDDLGQTVFVAHATIPRTLHTQAHRFFALMHGSIIVVSAVVFLSLGFALRRVVVRPIVEMKRAMRTLSESKSVTGRIAHEDDSEIGLLAGDIHRLLGKTARDMTFMRATEDALRRNEHILRLMAERTPSGFLLVDVAGGRVVYHNRVFCQVWAEPGSDDGSTDYESTPGEILERIGATLKNPDAALAFRTTLLEAGDDRVIDEEWELADGRTIRTYSMLLQTGDGTVIGRYYVFDDITARKRVEADLIRRGLLLEAVATASNLLISSTDHPAAMTDALAVVGTAVEAVRVDIFEIATGERGSRPILEPRFVWNAHEALEAGETPRTVPHLADEDLRRTIDALGDGHVVRERGSDGANASTDTLAILVPVHVDAHLWGFVRFEMMRPDLTWTDEDDSILLVAAGSIGADIARKAYEKKLVETVSELERMNRLMRGRENRVLELKAVINEMHERLGERPRYTVPESCYGAEDRRAS
ncbi:MAG: hypothetical protein KJ042_06885 [Deltaproteobacteria bacterium]|nr:hypothetical protein [Deltaproteobacteria bacterium]